jgi:hypothetical protein
MAVKIFKFIPDVIAGPADKFHHKFFVAFVGTSEMPQAKKDYNFVNDISSLEPIAN